MQGGSSSPDNILQVHTFGGFRLELAGRSLTDEQFRARKHLSVLYYLIAHRNRPVPYAELTDTFWPEDRTGDPVNALKVLLHRTRHHLAPLFDEPPLMNLRGAYQWNPDLPCQVDAERFERLCLRAKQADHLPSRQRAEFYQEALALYGDGFLPRQRKIQWVAAQADRYRALFHEAAAARVLLLENAEAHAPPAELHVVPAITGEAEAALERTMDALQQTLNLPAPQSGAFLCEFEIFQTLCGWEAHRSAHSGSCLYTGLLTLSPPAEAVPELLSAAMSRLQRVLLQCLRCGDALSRYGSAQYAVLLPSASRRHCEAVMERVVSAFGGDEIGVGLSWRLRALVPSPAL